MRRARPRRRPHADKPNKSDRPDRPDRGPAYPQQGPAVPGQRRAYASVQLLPIHGGMDITTVMDIFAIQFPSAPPSGGF